MFAHIQEQYCLIPPQVAPTAGLKDDDFASAGKVNGTPVADVILSEYEDKPWRKVGVGCNVYRM